MKRIAITLLLSVLSLAAAADPPGRVGRLAAIEGEVSVYADEARGWEPATPNAPITSENSVWTEPGARADLRIGSIALRLAETTQLDIAQLDDDSLRAHVMRGSLALRVRHFEPDESLVVTTPTARIEIRGNGRFRIDADAASGDSLVSVLSGTVRLVTAGGHIAVDTGRALRVAGGERTGYAFEDARESELDLWASARDERYTEGPAARYVSPRMTGWEDLDAYGEWRTEPDIGVLWYPSRVVTGWAPYRYGRWVWVRPWGWTWVDDAPWGYAPFHYGRWVYVGSRWGWYPGPRVRRPVWAPALVGWVGSPGWSVSISSGPMNVVGWYPLSPYDRYQPWYSARPTYVTNINNVVIVDRRPPRHRDNRDNRDHRDNRDRGATVVGRDHFVSRKPVQNGITRLPPEVIAAQPISHGSAVLPAPREDLRARPRPAAPTAPAMGSGRPERPTFEAQRPSAPTSKPATPVAPQPLPARPVEKPVAPAAPVRPYPSTRPVEKPPAATSPATAAPSGPPASPPAHRPAPRPAPVAPPAGSPAVKPVAPSAPAAGSVIPAPATARPAQKPAAPAAPAARPVEKPAAAPERPSGKGAEKPAGNAQEKPGKAQD